MKSESAEQVCGNPDLEPRRQGAEELDADGQPDQGCHRAVRDRRREEHAHLGGKFQ